MHEVSESQEHAQPRKEDPGSKPGHFYSKAFSVCPHVCYLQFHVVLLSCGNTSMGENGMLPCNSGTETLLDSPGWVQ